ncbi:MAG: DUF3341 domain-containing protein [Verrucomicrobiota bacterium JB022]|nr:DUF3341 domain-containing protein [Verrucomicrobiota bacterium JB022]
MSKPYGILALFDTAQEIYHAAEAVRDAGYKRWDCITPFPIHGMNEAMGLRRSLVGAFTLVGGITGFTTGMTIAWFMGQVNYPLIVQGKPYFSFVFPFPVAYELTILLSAFGTLLGMFLINRLPRHHHPVMDYSKFHRLMDDKFAVVIEVDDPLYDEARTRSLLEGLHPSEVVLLEDVEEVKA